MKHISMFIIAPVILFFFLILITDVANAAGGIFIYLLIISARYLYDRYKNSKIEHKKDSGE
ncbi:hypothetical protein ACFOU0_00940 [Salinicoccus sesuvii]|uniref:Uncharacterized protein n=1 Tax=Salinicoccus sesuvii TaxID=868281 RepID=A0ABV7N2S1_9STAP